MTSVDDVGGSKSRGRPRPQDGSTDPFNRPELRWGLGCLIGMASMVGLLILALLVAIALQPPTWLQVIIGLVLVIAGAALGWLVVSALDSGRKSNP